MGGLNCPGNLGSPCGRAWSVSRMKRMRDPLLDNERHEPEEDGSCFDDSEESEQEHGSSAMQCANVRKPPSQPDKFPTERSKYGWCWGCLMLIVFSAVIVLVTRSCISMSREEVQRRDTFSIDDMETRLASEQETRLCSVISFVAGRQGDDWR